MYNSIYDSNNEMEKNTIECLLDIVKYIKAFYGDIYGNFIYNWRILNNIQNECINFRIDSHTLSIFLNIISMHYNIIEIETSFNEPMLYNTYKLEHKTKKINPINIKALVLNKKTFRCFPPDFDIDLISEDNSSIYIRCIVPLTRFLIDSISHIKNRIIERRFCTLHRIHSIKISRDIGKTVDDAITLVKKGWIMDDNLLGNNAWIVAIWGDYIKNPQKYRTKGVWYDNFVKNREKEKNHTIDDFCSICHEKFKSNDIILSTSCCHNFHWQCTNDDNVDNNNGSNINGLKNWVIGHNRLCCPYCRSIMF